MNKEIYYHIGTMATYDEELNEVRKFRYTKEVEGLIEVIRQDTAGEKMVASLKHKIEDIGGGWYKVIEDATLEELTSAAKSLR